MTNNKLTNNQCGICADCVPQINGGSGFNNCAEAHAAQLAEDKAVMNTIKIAWLEGCTWCGCAELNVVTESGDENKLNLNDAVSCPECGAVGEIDCDDGCAFVAWAEPEPCPRCGVVSTRPNGEHYCHSDSARGASE